MGAPDDFLKLSATSSALEAAANAWGPMIASQPDAAWMIEGQSQLVVAANTAAHQLLGFAPGGLLGERAENLLLIPEDMAYWSEALNGRPEPHCSEITLFAPDGRRIRVRRSIQPFAQGESAQPFFMVLLNDLSDQFETQERLELATTELQATLESTADGIFVTDLNDHIRVFNRRFAELWSLPQRLLEERDDAAVHAWLRSQVADVENYDSRLRELANATRQSAVDRLQLRCGKLLERSANPLWQGGRSLGRVYSFRDLTEREAAHQRIIELSSTDPLTGLGNRAELAAVVAKAAQHSVHGGSGYALMLVDLDRFSAINESLGASSADLVLLEVARRLRGTLRQGDRAARLAGDQFAVLVHDADALAAETAAKRLLQTISATMQVGTLSFTQTCSIGVAVSPLHGRNLDELLGAADEAMRRAKQSGRATFRMHALRRVSDPRVSIRMDHAMRQALAQERFRVCFQPQVDVGSGEVVGAEALLRWNDPDFGGEVSPARFIPVAEDSGLIIALGDWVLRQSLRQAAIWHERVWTFPWP